ERCDARELVLVGDAVSPRVVVPEAPARSLAAPTPLPCHAPGTLRDRGGQNDRRPRGRRNRPGAPRGVVARPRSCRDGACARVPTLRPLPRLTTGNAEPSRVRGRGGDP